MVGSQRSERTKARFVDFWHAVSEGLIVAKQVFGVGTNKVRLFAKQLPRVALTTKDIVDISSASVRTASILLLNKTFSGV